MSYLDYVVLGLAAFLLLGGFIRGMGRSFSSLVVWLCAFVSSGLLTDQLTPYLQHYVDDPPFAYLLTFLSIFFVVLIGVGFVNLIAGVFMIGSHKSWASRMMGGIIGVLRAGLIAFLTVFIISGVPGSKAPWIKHSLTYNWLQPWSKQLQKNMNFPQSSSEHGHKSLGAGQQLKVYPFENH